MPNGKSSGTGLAIWQDLKVLIVAGSLLSLCLAPLGLVLMWSWEVWSPKVRKVVTWLGIIGIVVFLACMMICGQGWKGRCGKGWAKGCGTHGGSQSWGQCEKGWSKSHCEADDDDDKGEDEDDGEDEVKSEVPTKEEAK